MRILAVLRARSSGGSPRSLADVLDHFVVSNDVWLATADEVPDLGAPAFDARITHIALGQPASTAVRAGAQVPVLRALRRAIRDVKPDVLLSWGTWANLVTLVARIGTSVPVIASERVDPRERGGGLRQTIRTTAYRVGRPEAVVANAQDLADYLGRIVGPARAHAIPNVVRFGTDTRADVTASRIVVGAGRLVHQKGFDLLIRAFATCAATRPDWRLCIFGEGEDRAKLESLARELGIAERVELPGFSHNLAAEFARAAIFVLSSRFEGSPRVTAEALGSGLPVVAFDCPTGPREVVRDDVDGFLVAPESVAGLAEAIARLMDDASLRARFAARAPEVVERFGVSRTFAAWDALLGSVTHHR